MVKKWGIILMLNIGCCCSDSWCQSVQRNLLTKTYSYDVVKSALSVKKQWCVFPGYAQREKWNALPAEYQTFFITNANTYLQYKWEYLKATSYLAFERAGDRMSMELNRKKNLDAFKALVLGELVEGKGRYIDQIIDGVWFFCESSSWILSANIHLQKRSLGLPDVNEPVVELYSCEVAVFLSWACHFFKKEFDAASPLIAERIEAEVHKRILIPYYSRNDFYWLGFDDRVVNNWNIWINMNVAKCIMLMERDSSKQAEGLYKTMRSVDKFINSYKEDGACEEGPAYWSRAGSYLFEYLRLLRQATADTINIYNDPLIADIGRYIYKAHINDRYYINFSDASAKLNPDPGTIYYYGKEIGDDVMKRFGSYLAEQQGLSNYLNSVISLDISLYDLLFHQEITSVEPLQPLLANNWFRDNELVTARQSAGSLKGFYFAAKGGNNGTSHSHNDVGSCILFHNGHPLFIDVGREVYNGKTFSAERYSIWMMRSDYHNLPAINGFNQREGRNYAATHAFFKNDESGSEFSVDIAKAYPAAADVNKWVRKYKMKAGKAFVIEDEYELKQNHGNTRIHFMTTKRVSVISSGALALGNADGTLFMRFDAKKMDVSVEEIPVTDSVTLQSWPPLLHRIIFSVKHAKLKGRYTFLIQPSTDIVNDKRGKQR